MESFITENGFNYRSVGKGRPILILHGLMGGLSNFEDVFNFFPQKNYNVKQDFKNKFLKNHKKNKIFFKNEKNLIYFNLPDYVKSQLKLNKINKIDMLNIDTYNIKNNFFSARRSLKLKHADYGRNISIIMIN